MRYIMHDTYGSDNLRCAGMEKKPRIRAVTLADSLDRFDARMCPVCMPFYNPRERVVVVERRAT